VADDQALDDVRSLCRRYLEDSGLDFTTTAEGYFRLSFAGDVNVLVQPMAFWGRATVAVTAVINHDMRVDGELCEFIAVQNAGLLFGRLCLYKELDQVRFEDALLGEFLNREELKFAVEVVAATSIDYRGKIKERWGGW
jgi:hypothetical protein